MLLTRSPLGNKVLHAEAISSKHPVRLACVRRAASVRSEPESNSQILKIDLRAYFLSSQRSVDTKWYDMNFTALFRNYRI